MLAHEKMYRSVSISAVIHRVRLRRIFEVFASLDIPDHGRLGDFGCSNGYLISQIQERLLSEGKEWQYFGFDFNKEYLSVAEERRLRNAQFYHFDLNQEPDLADKHWSNQFDVITCFETLEHLRYERAVLHLYDSCKIDGIIFITVPNEKGIPGMVKFFGRIVLRRNPYEEFFAAQSRLKYIWHLITDQSIEEFRPAGESDSYGPHLGFDWKALEAFIQRALIDSGKCKLSLKKVSFLGFNRFYVLEKLK